YIAAAEHEAHVWLNNHVDRSDIVLSTLESGNRMAKYVSCRFVLGHWSVTPHVKELSNPVERFYAGTMSEDEATALLDEVHVQWIYIGSREQNLGRVDPLKLKGVAERYANGPVRIFSYEPAGPLSVAPRPSVRRTDRWSD